MISHEKAKQVPLFGMWECADGRQILFNRNWQALWERPSADALASPADPSEWIPYVSTNIFYSNKSAPKRNGRTRMKLKRILNEWGVQ